VELLKKKICASTNTNPDTARDFYQRGLKNCLQSISLWIASATLEEKCGQLGKGRSLLEKARLANVKNPDLWLAGIRMEMRAGNEKVALAKLATALQECPTSGILWAEAINTEKRPQQKARSVDALKKCDNDPNVIVSVARVFWADRKLTKARTWFNRAVTLNPDLGDGWAYYYKFELQHGTDEQKEEVMKRCIAAEPRHGEYWRKVYKDPGNRFAKVDDILRKVVLLI